jgi:acyl-CoA reductase-like NAD-dependent aldehyde dehydrogenase
VGDTNLQTSPKQLEAALTALRAAAPGWAATPLAVRAALARDCACRTLDVAEAMAADAVAYKGAYETGDGEEMAVWAAAPSVLHDLALSLDALAAGRPRQPVAVRWRAGAPGAPPQAVARVFPDSLFEHLLFSGYAGELWLQPGASARASGADVVRGGPGELCLVLGAGNQAVVALADVALKVLVHGAVVVLKMNPVNEWAGPHFERCLAPLIAAGALRVVYGGPDVGKALTAHPAVQTVHITGSDKTYDAIMWGGAAKTPGAPPPYDKHVSAELGCVTPYTLVPGVWSEADIEAKAAEVVAAVLHNASCNCLAAKVLILGRHWAQRDAFLAALRRRFGAAARRAAYYPGAQDKYDAFVAAFPDAQQLGQPLGDACAAGDLRTLPALLLPPAPPRAGDKALSDEAWSPVLALRELDTPAGDVPAFLDAAAAALNDACWGTLSCAVFIDPATERAHAAAFDAFLGALRYGSIAVNVPTLLSYFTPALSWGAFPGHTPDDIRSGVGQIHNTRLADGVQKSVLRAPWRPAVTPFWQLSHGNMSRLSRAIVRYMAQPGVRTLAAVIWHAALG